MKLIHIHARIRRKKSNYVKVKPEQVGENILNRNFKADYPNQKWCTDVTEFKVQIGRASCRERVLAGV